MRSRVTKVTAKSRRGTTSDCVLLLDSTLGFKWFSRNVSCPQPFNHQLTALFKGFQKMYTCLGLASLDEELSSFLDILPSPGLESLSPGPRVKHSFNRNSRSRVDDNIGMIPSIIDSH